MCSRVWRAWRARVQLALVLRLRPRARRGRRRAAPSSRPRRACPPGRRTSMSGRSAPSPVWIVLCSTKSQWETMPGHLHHVAQLDLAPRSARARPLQRRDEVAGLLAQRAHALAELADHLGELALRLAALALEPADLALHPPELLLHRPDDALDLLGAPRHLAAGALLLALRRLSATRCASDSPVCASTSTRDRLQLLAHALAAARAQRRRRRRRRAGLRRSTAARSVRTCARPFSVDRTCGCPAWHAVPRDGAARDADGGACDQVRGAAPAGSCAAGRWRSRSTA